MSGYDQEQSNKINSIKAYSLKGTLKEIFEKSKWWPGSPGECCCRWAGRWRSPADRQGLRQAPAGKVKSDSVESSWRKYMRGGDNRLRCRHYTLYLKHPFLSAVSRSSPKWRHLRWSPNRAVIGRKRKTFSEFDTIVRVSLKFTIRSDFADAFNLRLYGNKMTREYIFSWNIFSEICLKILTGWPRVKCMVWVRKTVSVLMDQVHLLLCTASSPGLGQLLDIQHNY